MGPGGVVARTLLPTFFKYPPHTRVPRAPDKTERALLASYTYFLRYHDQVTDCQLKAINKESHFRESAATRIGDETANHRLSSAWGRRAGTLYICW